MGKSPFMLPTDLDDMLYRARKGYRFPKISQNVISLFERAITITGLDRNFSKPIRLNYVLMKSLCRRN